MRSLVATLIAVAATVAVAAPAEARSVHYRSQHPLPRKIGHGFCYIDAPHVHDFGPSDPRLYREISGEYYFVGDPAPFDYEGPRYSFYGAHPVAEADIQFGQPVYCYLSGPHFHWYQPPPSAPFEFRGGAYWYVGNYDPVYYQERPRFVAVNEVYQPIVYTRPVVDVTVAPPNFHGEIVIGPGYQRAQAVVAPPVVTGGITIGIGVAPPPPIQVGIGVGVGVVGIGGPPVVIQDRRELREVREHHDNGRHNGWNRHEYENHGWHGGPGPQQPPRGSAWRAPPSAPPPAAHGGVMRGVPPAGPAPAPRHDKHAPPGNGWRGR